MASTIDATKPIAVSPTTQSVRDNFAAAKAEIETLQAAVDTAVTPNYGFFGPASGAAAPPTYRALVPDDLPTMTDTVAGKVPTPPNDATQFLDGTGNFSTPAGGGGLTNWTDGINAAAPNTVTKVSALTAANAATNLDAAIIPKGLGALITRIPDNTAAGGNKRGENAVDLQLVRTINDRVASGDKSFIGGGQNNRASTTYTAVVGGDNNAATAGYAFVGSGTANTASGTTSVVAGGDNNTASGNTATVGGGYSSLATGAHSTVAGGYANTASGQHSYIGGGAGASTRGIIGMYAHSARYTGTRGEVQYGRYILRGDTASATPKTITADESAAGTTNQVILPNSSAFTFQARMTARNTANGDSAAFIFSGLIRRGANAAATALAAAVASPIGPNDDGAAAWTVAVTADTVNGGLKIEVTGAASTNIRWACVIDTTEIAS